jgi:hypothetical protein
MARVAQATPVLGVVGVATSLDEFASAEWPVVGVLGWLAAWVRMVVAFLGADARRVLGEDAGAEAGEVLAAVSALLGGAAFGFGFASVVFAATALSELWAAGFRADSPASTSRHGAHLFQA